MRSSDLEAVDLDIDLLVLDEPVRARLEVHAGLRTLHTAVLDDDDVCDAWTALPGTKSVIRMQLRLPASLATALATQPGTRRVRFLVAGLPAVESTFDLVPPPASTTRRLAHVRARLHDRPSWIRRLVEAQVLHEDRYHAAAHALALSVLRERAGEPHAAALIYATYAEAGVLRSHRALDFGLQVMDAAREQRRARGLRCGLEETVEAQRTR